MRSQVTVPDGPPAALPLIETKLLRGRVRPELLPRRRLLAELDRLSSAALTLIDAPVGFGKTVLAQSWCAHTDSEIAWVSLDEADNDPVRLWTYVATSVDRIRPGLGRMALARLRVPGASPALAADELANGLASFDGPVAIVLDDLHLVRSDECLLSLEHAVERLPPGVRIVATTRADPALPLGRLRARGALGEIRAADLAFRVDEAREMLVVQEGIALDASDVELLVERTEGWPAGLYLAALWLRGSADPKAEVTAFHGSHRHVAEYLSGELLDTLDDETRRFLVETSTLPRFTAALCDAALERTASAERLREIERTNGFLVALDAHGEWYRYHHLFRELLQLELRIAEPAAAITTHRRASLWCREHGLTEEALEHSAEAGDLASTADLLAEESTRLLRAGHVATLLRWGAALPDELLIERPVLPVGMAIAAGLAGGAARGRHRFVALAERSRAEHPERWTGFHEAHLGIVSAAWVERDLGGAIADGLATVELARASVAEAAVPALASVAMLHFFAGDLEQSRALAVEALARPEIALRPHGFVFALAVIALIDAEEGHPEAAEERALESLAKARELGLAEVASGGVAHLALASALAANGRLRAAEREAIEAERLRRHREPELAHLHALLVLANIRARCGRLDGAAGDLELARRGLETFGDAGRLPALAAAVERLLADARSAAGGPVETPSAAELSVLELLASDLSQREIGARLYLSVNTVKTHARSLYRKLGVGSREEAVARATALGLLDTSDSPG